MTVARLIWIFLFIHMSSCFENSQIDPSDYRVGNDEHNAPAPGSFGKYFIYVNCTTCKVKSELQVKANGANKEEERVSKDETKTTRKSTYYPVSPGERKGRLEGKTTPHGATKEGGKTGRTREGFPVLISVGGRGEKRKTTQYGDEGEGEVVEEEMEEAARLERMKVNETTARQIYHLPGDTPYPPWFTIMVYKTIKKSGTGGTGTEVTGNEITGTGTELAGTEITGTGGTDTEVTGTVGTGTEVTGTGGKGTEVTGTGGTGTEITSTGESNTVVIHTGRTGTEVTGIEEMGTEEVVTGGTGIENESTAETTTKEKKKKP